MFLKYGYTRWIKTKSRVRFRWKLTNTAPLSDATEGKKFLPSIRYTPYVYTYSQTYIYYIFSMYPHKTIHPFSLIHLVFPKDLLAKIYFQLYAN